MAEPQTRYAIVRNARAREEVAPHLASDWRVVREVPENEDAPFRAFVIAGETPLGELASKLAPLRMTVEEIKSDHPLLLEPAGENVWAPVAPAGPDPTPVKPPEWEEL